MLNYSKVIVDVSNIFYRVAAFYLKDLDKTKLNSLIKSNIVFSQYKNILQNLTQQTMGTVCLLFDPLLSNGKISERLKIKEGYKQIRDRNTPPVLLRVNTLEKLYSFFITSNMKRIEVYHDVSMEADDFVEKLSEVGDCLLMTSDEDWCRYLEDGRVEMLAQGISIKEDSIFTASDFEKKHGFKPNISSVSFWKALYGDPSDNIVGAFTSPKTKVIKPADEEMQKILKILGEENPNIEEVKRNFYNGTGIFTRLKELLQLSNTDRSFEKLLNITDENLQVIESRIPRNSDIDINKYKVKLEFEINKEKKKFSLNGLKID